ncbi:ACP S-malonyltransferase [Desulfovibrio ferrophilus]|uniref:Malonyl CoA-acyl carrier protein transacylase n=1 Tax=Desulfovibrio ferrophilus TaxID=241368 RepID=A0A2Z6AVR0_9BACT|nr:ACP S-malonyltransferase [Desulfovibrio ferrophilus]BBD07300.1 malonyl CoA-acyl carrier protein transacylase [Desulfovibrio ferrophilus]
MNAITPLTAVLFPGQGSQVKNMGRDLAEEDSDYMYWWTKAEAISQQPLREIYWGGDDQDMADTRALQPALTVTNLTLWMHAAKKIKADSFAGHSLGEYAALAAAKVLDVEKVLELVSLRGKLMAEAGAPDQGMTALLKLSQEDAEALVVTAREQSGAELIVANYNTPGQFVISGQKPALEAAAAIAKEKKGRAIPLPVSGAFHSPLIDEAAQELKVQLLKADWRTPEADVFFNATASTEGNPEIIKDIMCRQMVSPVRWIEINQTQYRGGSRTFIEIGPKGVLAKMLGQNLKGLDKDWTGTNLDTMAAIDEAE